jgi:hypothetical protein
MRQFAPLCKEGIKPPNRTQQFRTLVLDAEKIVHLAVEDFVLGKRPQRSRLDHLFYFSLWASLLG